MRCIAILATMCTLAFLVLADDDANSNVGELSSTAEFISDLPAHQRPAPPKKPLTAGQREYIRVAKSIKPVLYPIPVAPSVERAREALKAGRVQAQLGKYFGEWVRKPKVLSAIRNAMLQGRVVIIEDAMNLEFLNRTWDELREVEDHEYTFDSGGIAGYQYAIHQHYIPGASTREEGLKFWTRAMRTMVKLYDSEPMKHLVSYLSHSDAYGPISAGFSHMRKGDYIGPHNDHSQDGDYSRRVTWVLQMSKEWDPKWGGDFVWCHPMYFQSSGFNRLVLFSVSQNSCHWVSPVHPSAPDDRYRHAFSGWWTSSDEDTVNGIADMPNPQQMHQFRPGMRVDGETCLAEHSADPTHCLSHVTSAGHSRGTPLSYLQGDELKL